MYAPQFSSFTPHSQSDDRVATGATARSTTDRVATLAPVAVEPDRRCGPRVRTVYRITPVSVRDDQGLARIRNISDGGMQLDMTLPVVLGDRVKVLLSATHILKGRVVWTNGNECGLRFDEPIDSIAMLHESSEAIRAPGARAPRLPVNTIAVAESEGSTRAVKVCDVSQRGMKITDDGSFTPGIPVRVTLASGVQRRGIVRWSKDGFAGVLLTETFSPSELGRSSKL